MKPSGNVYAVTLTVTPCYAISRGQVPTTKAIP